jgi:hypothetical protein
MARSKSIELSRMRRHTNCTPVCFQAMRRPAHNRLHVPQIELRSIAHCAALI